MDPQDMCCLPCGKYKGRTFCEILAVDPGYCDWVQRTVTAGPLQLFKEFCARKRSPPKMDSPVMTSSSTYDYFDSPFPSEIFDFSEFAVPAPPALRTPNSSPPPNLPRIPECIVVLEPPSPRNQERRIQPQRKHKPASGHLKELDCEIAVTLSTYIQSLKHIQQLLQEGLQLVLLSNDDTVPSWTEPAQFTFTFEGKSGQVTLPRVEEATEEPPIRRRVRVKLPAVPFELLHGGFLTYLRSRRGATEGSLEESLVCQEHQRMLAVARYVSFVVQRFGLATPQSDDEVDRVLVRFIADSHLWEHFVSQLRDQGVCASTVANHLQALEHASEYGQYKLQRLADKEEQQRFSQQQVLFRKF
jgi:hypothetical protein